MCGLGFARRPSVLVCVLHWSACQTRFCRAEPHLTDNTSLLHVASASALLYICAGSHHTCAQENKKRTVTQLTLVIWCISLSIIYIPPTSSLPPLQYLQQLFLALWDIKPLAGFYRWQCASVGACWGRACTQPCRTEEDRIEIFKGNALALDGGLEAA